MIFSSIVYMFKSKNCVILLKTNLIYLISIFEKVSHINHILIVGIIIIVVVVVVVVIVVVVVVVIVIIIVIVMVEPDLLVRKL